MADPTDDPADEDYEVAPHRRGAWNPAYLKKFTKLLIENTCVLQNTGRFKQDDPIHELRKRAMEHIRIELGMSSLDQVKARLVSFRKFAANKMRFYADRCSRQAKPETILRSAPRWIRELEPHLSIWGQIRNSKVINTPASSTGPPPPAPAPAPPPRSPPPSTRMERIALSLVMNARSRRSLLAHTVTEQIDGVPEDKRPELRFAWWRMLDIVRQKLAIYRDGGDNADYSGVGFTPVETMLADLVLLLDDTIATVPETCDYESMQPLVALFHLAQLHRLEDNPTPDRWRRAHRAFRARNKNVGGISSSIVFMQRRWHELKARARRAITTYRRGGEEPAPAPLLSALVKRFPRIVTEPLKSWREVVDSGGVIEEVDESVEVPEQAIDPEELSRVFRFTGELAQYDRSAKDDEDDLVLIEKEIETIDLINVADEEKDSQRSEKDVNTQQKVRKKRSHIADALEKEIDQQLKQLHSVEGESELTLLGQVQPVGEPMFIYDSDDDDLECVEDRLRNIEMIASQLEDEDKVSVKVKNEEIEIGDEFYTKAHVADDDGDEESDNEDCVEIDRKLLMDAQIRLIKVNETPQWKSHAKRQSSIDINDLDMTLLEPKRARGALQAARELVSEGCEPEVVVKIEKIDHTSSSPSGERQVKSMAKRLISEIMKDETDVTDKRDTDPDARVTKKVQLPNIEEVRKNNLNMLTAQVAPLAADEGELVIDEDCLTADVPEELRVVKDLQRDDSLTQNELDLVLARLTAERISAKEVYPMCGQHHCCTARRQRALNAARRRVAKRAGRPPPPPLDIHSTSNCRGQECACCCKHLLQEGTSSVRLQQDAKRLELALRRLIGEETTETEAECVEVETTVTKPPPRRHKKPTEQTTKSLETKESDPFKEWIRQKTVHQQYFNLNLKPQTDNNETRKYILLPTSNSNPNASPKILYTQNKNPVLVINTDNTGKVSKIQTTNQPPVYQRIQPKPTANETESEKINLTVLKKVGQETVPLPVTVPINNTFKTINASFVVKSPSKQLPGKTLVKLNSLSSQGKMQSNSDQTIVTVDQVTNPSTSKQTVSLPSTSKQTISLQSTSKQTISLQSTSKQTISLQSTSKQTISLPSTSKETISLPSSSKQTISLPSTSKQTISLPSTSKQTISLPSTSKQTISLQSTSKQTISLPSTSKETFSLPLTLKQQPVSIASKQLVSIASKQPVSIAPKQAVVIPSTSNQTVSSIVSTSKQIPLTASTSKQTAAIPSTSKQTASIVSTLKHTLIAPKPQIAIPSNLKQSISNQSIPTQRLLNPGLSNEENTYTLINQSALSGNAMTYKFKLYQPLGKRKRKYNIVSLNQNLKPIKIAPKPNTKAQDKTVAKTEQEKAEQEKAEQEKTGQDNTGQSTEKESQRSSKQPLKKIVIGGKNTNLDSLRGTGMKIVKVSSVANPPAESQSPVKDQLELSPPKTKRVTVVSKDGLATKEMTVQLQDENAISLRHSLSPTSPPQRVLNSLAHRETHISSTPLLSGGAVLTRIGKNSRTKDTVTCKLKLAHHLGPSAILDLE